MNIDDNYIAKTTAVTSSTSSSYLKSNEPPEDSFEVISTKDTYLSDKKMI